MNHHYELWAPRAEAVRLVLDPHSQATSLSKATEMVASGDLETINLVGTDEWWMTPQPVTASGNYGFQLYTQDGWSQVLPDPRSQRQPDGVHGLSSFRPDYSWHDQEYTGHNLAGQVLYELHVGTFSPAGTFAGVIEKLDHLKELGVTAIELMPVQPFGGTRNWGYDGVDWLAVHEAYGGPQGLQELVDAAHQQGIAVVLDVVFNHFGPDGNYNGMFGPYTVPGDTGWGDVVNISGPQSDPVRAFILQAVRQWLEDFHIDGLRLDAVHAYQDTLAVSLLEQMQAVADEVSTATGIPRFLIAESDLNDPRLLDAPSYGGYGLAGQWVDDIHHSIHTLISQEDVAYYRDYHRAGVAGLAKGLAGMYFFDGTYSTFRQRTHGQGLSSRISPAQGVTYTTTHDQTGNRAQGDRPSQNLSTQQLALRAATVLLSPYTPMLFMGEEFAAQTPFPFFVSHEDAQLNDATRTGRLHEFARHGWEPAEVVDPVAESSFSAAKLDWDLADSQAALLRCYQQLLQLRRSRALGEREFSDFVIRYGTATSQVLDAHDLLGKEVLDFGPGWLSIGYEDLLFVGNYQDVACQVDLSQLGVATPSTLQVHSNIPCAVTEISQGLADLPAWGFVVLTR